MYVLRVVIDVGYFQVLLEKEVIINFNQELGGNGS